MKMSKLYFNKNTAIFCNTNCFLKRRSLLIAMSKQVSFAAYWISKHQQIAWCLVLCMKAKRGGLLLNSEEGIMFRCGVLSFPNHKRAFSLLTCYMLLCLSTQRRTHFPFLTPLFLGCFRRMSLKRELHIYHNYNQTYCQAAINYR